MLGFFLLCSAAFPTSTHCSVLKLGFQVCFTVAPPLKFLLCIFCCIRVLKTQWFNTNRAEVWIACNEAAVKVLVGQGCFFWSLQGRTISSYRSCWGSLVCVLLLRATLLWPLLSLPRPPFWSDFLISLHFIRNFMAVDGASRRVCA